MPRLPSEPFDETLADEPRLIEIGLVGPQLGGYAVIRALYEGDVAPVSKANSLVSDRVSNSISPRGVQFRLGTVSYPLCRSELSCPGLKGIDQKSLLLRLMLAQPAGGGKAFCPVPRQ